MKDKPLFYNIVIIKLVCYFIMCPYIYLTFNLFLLFRSNFYFYSSVWSSVKLLLEKNVKSTFFLIVFFLIHHIFSIFSCIHTHNFHLMTKTNTFVYNSCEASPSLTLLLTLTLKTIFILTLKPSLSPCVPKVLPLFVKCIFLSSLFM